MLLYLPGINHFCLYGNVYFPIISKNYHVFMYNVQYTATNFLEFQSMEQTARHGFITCVLRSGYKFYVEKSLFMWETVCGKYVAQNLGLASCSSP